jgi:hypothetical protein
VCGVTHNCSTDYKHEENYSESYIKHSVPYQISNTGETLQETETLQEQEKAGYPESYDKSADDDKLENSTFLTETEDILKKIHPHDCNAQYIFQITM